MPRIRDKDIRPGRFPSPDFVPPPFISEREETLEDEVIATPAPCSTSTAPILPATDAYEVWAAQDDPELVPAGKPSSTRLRSTSSRVLMFLGFVLMLTSGLLAVYAPSHGVTPPSTTPSTAPSTVLPGRGWEAPEASLALEPLLPTLAQIRPVLSSSLEITHDGPLPLDPSADAASSAIAPGVTSAWSRMFSPPAADSALAVTLVAYGSQAEALTAIEALADILGAETLPSSAPSPAAFSLPAADALFLAPSDTLGSSKATSALVRSNVLVVVTAPSLAQSLLALSIPASALPSKAPSRISQVGSSPALRPASQLTSAHPPLSESWPLPGLVYPLSGTTLCAARIESLHWSAMPCQFQTALPGVPG